MTAAIRIDGLEQLNKILKEMPDNVQRKVAVAGVRIAGSRLRTFMRRHVKRLKDKGLLEKAISMKYGKGKNAAKVTVGLNSRFYYKTLEQGRKAYERTNKRGTRFKVSATPIMNSQGLNLESVWNTHKDDILKILVEGMQQALYKELGRMSVQGLKSRRR
jgi:hypothetical protein